MHVDDLRFGDLPTLAWAGDVHIRHVRDELDRVRRAEVDYLVVRSDDGVAVAKGGVDYGHPSGVPRLWQLATRPDMQGRGIGTRLIAALEERARRRGHGTVALAVEVLNVRAIALYERLGYEVSGSETSGGEQQAPDGSTYWHDAELLVMTKAL